MGVTVAPGVVDRIERESHAIVLQVQRASDPEAAASAFARAAQDIAGLGWTYCGQLSHPTWVSEVMPAGSGPFVMIDARNAPRGLPATIPDLVVVRLEEAGVGEAVVASPHEVIPIASMWGPAHALGLPRAVTLQLYGRWDTFHELSVGQRASIPDSWLVEAAAWVGGSGDDELHGLHPTGLTRNSVEFPLPAGDALAALRRDAPDSWLELLAGTPARGIRRCLVNSNPSPRASLSGGGPKASDGELIAVAEALVAVARRLAPEVAYAAVSVEPTFGTGKWLVGDAEWWLYGSAADHNLLERICDEVVFDAYAYQVLGPLHLARLGGPPAGAEPLAGGRVGVAVGHPGDWLLAPPDNPYDLYRDLCGRRQDATVCERGRALLAPLLVRAADAGPLIVARERRSLDDAAPGAPE